MKSPLTRSLLQANTDEKKAITYVTTEKSKFIHYEISSFF